MDSWDVDLCMVATLSLEQGFEKILVVVCPLFPKRYLSIFGFFLLVHSSYYNANHNICSLMTLKIMDACKLAFEFFLTKMPLNAKWSTPIEPPWKWFQKVTSYKNTTRMLLLASLYLNISTWDHANLWDAMHYICSYRCILLYGNQFNWKES